MVPGSSEIAGLGDRAFFRVNSRLEPEQLEAGSVASSLNGRMDRGSWQTRRAIRNLSGALEVDGSPLMLPFFLVDTTGGRSFAPGTLTVSGTVSPAMDGTFEVGYGLANVLNGRIAYTSQSDPNHRVWWTGSEWRAGDVLGLSYWHSAEDVVSPDLVTVWTNSGTTGTLAMVSASVGASRADTLVTLFVAGHGFEVSSSAHLGVESLSGTVSPNGVWLMTVLDEATLSFSIPGASGSETYTGAGKVRSVLDDADAAEIYGSCLFSDPSSDSAESIVIAATGKAVLVAVSDGDLSDVAYPTGSTLSGEVDLLQAFDKVLLFRDGAQAWEWYPAGRAVTAGGRATNVVTLTLKNHGLTVGDSVVVSGITGYGADDPNGTVVVTGIPTSDTFTYADIGADDTFDANTGTVVAGFTKVQAGAFTQPQVFQETGTDVDVVSGLCTISGLTNTTVEEGDEILIYGTDNAAFLPYVGRSFTVTAASSSAISFYIPIADLSTINTDVLFFGKQVSVGAGFQHMPAPPWGVYHQRRLIVPYRYSQTGTTASPTFTDRDVRDELVISDILDSDTFDAIENQFRITAGIADFLVGAHPFADDHLLVFMRNSIHLISGMSGSLSDTSTHELTREIGCLARKSIVQHGSQVLFLSDNGVYAVEFLDAYNLRGVDLPLSDAIQDQIDRINASLAGGSVGCYFNNRYYLAIPMDSAAGAGDATGNNAILVYNFLNSGWESVDSVDDTRWDVLNFHIARAGERNDLYAVNSNGGVHKLDAADSDVDELALSPGEDIELLPVVSSMQTRGYDAGLPDRKRWKRVTLQVEAASQPCDYEIEFSTENPDSASLLGAFSTLEGQSLDANEGYSQRVRVGGYRGHSASVTITPTEGRPKVKALHVEADETNKSTVSQS